jgi:hypothetical protein
VGGNRCLLHLLEQIRVHMVLVGRVDYVGECRLRDMLLNVYGILIYVRDNQNNVHVIYLPGSLNRGYGFVVRPRLIVDESGFSYIFASQ